MSSDLDADTYAAQIREHRQNKDEFFAEHPHSPIPQAERDEFTGLNYYDPDPVYRFVVDLYEHDNPEEITVETTQDGARTYHDVGEFRFDVDGEEVTLHAFQQPDDEARLWVPFRDETSGDETYPAGRYLDLEDPDDRTDDGAWVLDFNEAYSPFCAYSEAYECPLVPMDNWLDVAIRAGETLPDL